MSAPQEWISSALRADFVLPLGAGFRPLGGYRFLYPLSLSESAGPGKSSHPQNSFALRVLGKFRYRLRSRVGVLCPISS